MSLEPSVVQALGWTLLHFVWQGAALAALFAALNAAFRHATPSSRYVLAAATLLVMLALPLATFTLLARPASLPTWTAAARADALCAEGACAQTTPGMSPSLVPPESLRLQLDAFLPALVAGWGVGVLILSLRTLGGWALVQRLKRNGLSPVPESLQATFERLREAVEVSVPVRLYRSALVQVPTALGWLRPVILVP